MRLILIDAGAAALNSHTMKHIGGGGGHGNYAQSPLNHSPEPKGRRFCAPRFGAITLLPNQTEKIEKQPGQAPLAGLFLYVAPSLRAASEASVRMGSDSASPRSSRNPVAKGIFASAWGGAPPGYPGLRFAPAPALARRGCCAPLLSLARRSASPRSLCGQNAQRIRTLPSTPQRRYRQSFRARPGIPARGGCPGMSCCGDTSCCGIAARGPQ
jgi:hypothetical protein